MNLRKLFLTIVPFLVSVLPLPAQSAGQTDSVVVLMNATSLELIEDVVGFKYRKAIDARFLHNNTYLICDTALWNVNTKIINAFGHVQIIQDNTVLSSEKLDYLIDEDLAQFRGDLVQLMDKDGNTLRTRFLDYNTKDSVAVFERGASMKDKDGQVIESMNGTYDSKGKLFTFDEDVNMYTDSVYVKTARLLFHTDYDFAEFFGNIDAWKGKNMLSSDKGTYDKPNDRFFFTGDVHVMSDTQEGWSDSLYYDRTFNNVEMYGNIQITDTTRKVSALADKLVYVDSLSSVTLEKNAAVVAETDQNGQIDTVYMGAGRFVYHTVQKCDINGNIIEAAAKRLSDLEVDPVTAYRKKAAEEAAKAAEAAKDKDDPNDPVAAAKKRQAAAAAVDVDALKIDRDSIDTSAVSVPSVPDPLTAGADLPAVSTDSLSVGADSLSLDDSLMILSDSIALSDSVALSDPIAPADSATMAETGAGQDSTVVKDTTKIGFLTALDSVRMFKSDMQAFCDSLEYCDLDSLARLFLSPVVWNEENRQYSSDSLFLAIKDKRMDKASLMSNAFIIIQEDSICFDQIKSTEIMAYFDTSAALKRFDALGGASALFYIQENDAYATANKVESKMLSAIFKDGDIDRVSYFDSPKNDAYPIVQLPKEERTLKGFNWLPGLRPEGKEDITPLELRGSQRTSYTGRPMPMFSQTEKYFPGHMASIRKMLASQDSIRRVRHAEDVRRQKEAEELNKAALDSTASARVPDSTDIAKTSADSLAVKDLPAPSDTTAAADTLSTLLRSETVKTRAQEAEEKRHAKLEAREKRWAELDARDAEKEAEKEAVRQEKKRQKTYKAVRAAEKEAAKDKKKYDRYVRKYEKARERRLARDRSKL